MRNCEMSLAHDNSRTVGRKKHWSEDMQARFKAETFERIKKVIYDHEDRTDFVRVYRHNNQLSVVIEPGASLIPCRDACCACWIG